MAISRALVFAAAGLSILTSGCVRLQAQSRANPRSIALYSENGCPLTREALDTRDGSVNLDCFRFLEKPGRAYDSAVFDEDYRNRLVEILLKHSDDACEHQLGKLTADEATVNTSLGIAASGFAASASIVSGELAKSILAGISGFAGASRDHINVNVYRNQIAAAIGQAIQVQRDVLKKEIRGKYNSTRTSWSIDAGIRDVNEYHQTCSFHKGIELVLSSVQGKKDLDELIKQRADDSELIRCQARLKILQSSIAVVKDEASRKKIDENIASVKCG